MERILNMWSEIMHSIQKQLMTIQSLHIRHLSPEIIYAKYRHAFNAWATKKKKGYFPILGIYLTFPPPRNNILLMSEKKKRKKWRRLGVPNHDAPRRDETRLCCCYFSQKLHCPGDPRHMFLADSRRGPSIGNKRKTGSFNNTRLRLWRNRLLPPPFYPVHRGANLLSNLISLPFPPPPPPPSSFLTSPRHVWRTTEGNNRDPGCSRKIPAKRGSRTPLSWGFEICRDETVGS